jgi:hypothetical protein
MEMNIVEVQSRAQIPHNSMNSLMSQDRDEDVEHRKVVVVTSLSSGIKETYSPPVS